MPDRAKKQPAQKSASERHADVLDARRKDVVSSSKSAISSLKRIMEGKKSKDLEARGKYKLSRLSDKVGTPIDQLKDKAVEEMQNATTLDEINTIKAKFDAEIIATKRRIVAYIKHMAEGGTDSAHIDAEDIARIEHDVNLGIDKVSSLLISEHKDLVKAFSDIMRGAGDEKSFAVVSKYVDGENQDYAWTVIRSMNAKDKMNFTKKHFEVAYGGDGEKIRDFIDRGVSGGVYSTREVISIVPDYYKGNEMKMLADQKKFNSVNDMKSAIQDITDYNKLNDIGDKLSLGGIFKLFAKAMAALTIGGNVIVNSFARTGKFSLKDGIVEGIIKNPYTLGSGALIKGMSMYENGESVTDMVKSKAERAKERKESARRRVVKLADENPKIYELLSMSDGVSASRGSQALNDFVTEKRGAKTESVNLKSFEKWLAGKKSVHSGELAYGDVLDAIKQNNASEKPWISNREFSAMANAYRDMRLNKSHARNMDREIFKQV